MCEVASSRKVVRVLDCELLWVTTPVKQLSPFLMPCVRQRRSFGRHVKHEKSIMLPKAIFKYDTAGIFPDLGSPADEHTLLDR